MAETYGVYDYRALPLLTVATLAAGLRDTARVRIGNDRVLNIPDRVLQALIFDAVNFIAWSRTKDAEKGKNRPKSLFDDRTKQTKKSEQFMTADEFEAKRKSLVEAMREGVSDSGD